MERLFPLPSVTARLGPASGAHHRDTDWDEGIPELRGFPCTQDNADLWKGNSESAQHLDEIPIRKRIARAEPAGRRPQARQTDRQLRAPAFLQEILDMFGEGDCLG